MFELKNTSWQQRYATPEIFTFSCRIEDKPELFSKVCFALEKSGLRLGEIKLTKVEPAHKVHDITVHGKDVKQVDTAVAAVNAIDGAKVLNIKNETLATHHRGAIDVVSRIPLRTITDLRMVYTPGVAQCCMEIVRDEKTARTLTGNCDRVAIATNGTAVLGLGNIGVLPSLPVMEGKASIFAEFVNISAFPILIETEDPDIFVETVVRIAKGFGAIQLEDVSAPACFEIEEKLRARLDIPVFHDDQHGTATVTLAALINALKYTNKKKEDCSVIMLGAGAAGVAISKILIEFGIKDVVLYDTCGPLYRGRTEKMNPYKQKLTEITNKNNQKCSFAEGFKGKDIFIGVAKPNMVTKEMIAAMNPGAIVLPLSNPIGEITVEEALEAGAAIAADGRTINNALAYPAIFRGALDANAPAITIEMQLAAAKKLAQLAPEGMLLPDILDRNVHAQVAKAVEIAAEQK